MWIASSNPDLAAITARLRAPDLPVAEPLAMSTDGHGCFVRRRATCSNATMTAIGTRTSSVSSHPPWWASSSPVTMSSPRATRRATRPVAMWGILAWRRTLPWVGIVRVRLVQWRGSPTQTEVAAVHAHAGRRDEIEVIRPALQADGGDIILRDVDEGTGVITVTLVGVRNVSRFDPDAEGRHRADRATGSTVSRKSSASERPHERQVEWIRMPCSTPREW